MARLRSSVRLAVVLRSRCWGGVMLEARTAQQRGTSKSCLNGQNVSGVPAPRYGQSARSCAVRRRRQPGVARTSLYGAVAVTFTYLKDVMQCQVQMRQPSEKVWKAWKKVGRGSRPRRVWGAWWCRVYCTAPKVAVDTRGAPCAFQASVCRSMCAGAIRVPKATGGCQGESGRRDRGGAEPVPVPVGAGRDHADRLIR